ncbi:MAG: EAL domain-containing response regulator [Leptospiraceae bacterium]|nr:EAL domain-containing response regulator [Leptospiraceae bacterium]
MTNSSKLEGKKKPVILCVDDEVLILQSLGEQIELEFGEEFDVKMIDAPPSALEFIAECNSNHVEIPVIICDQIMPVMHGDDFLVLIHQTNPEIRKIMLTGFASGQEVGKALNKANLYRFISKPYQINDLHLTIREAIRSYFTDKSLVEKNKELERALFYNSETNLANWENLQKRLSEYSVDGLTLSLAIIKIENYIYFIEYFGAKIYNKILLELIKIISSKVLDGEEMFHTQQDEFLVLSTKPISEEFIHKFSLFRMMLKSEYIEVEGLAFQVSLFISFTSGNKNLYSTAKSGLLHRVNNSTSSSLSEHTNEIEFHKQNIFWGRKFISAIQNKAIVPFYQGIMDNRTKKISKFECLVRINDNGTIVNPDKFLNIANATGMIKLITIIVMDKAFSLFSKNDFAISINITQFDLEYKDFAQLVEAKLQHYNMSPSRITFEILENISLNINNQSLQTISQLRKMGCKIAIDDFGIHFSNLARLLEIQPDFIKIDGWFIKNINTNRRAYLVTKAIIELSHSLNAEVIAEFVSEKEIQDKLLELGVEHSQGFYIGKPSPTISINQ